MSDVIIRLSDRRSPVRYTVDLVHHWDDRLEIHVRDVADDERSTASVVASLRRAADALEARMADGPGLLMKEDD